ncbi:hypothetical protein [Halomarina oriensis]|uniref:Uncharacterized protein n=1 Tax=Halomarina oriensis TaxID=671145 RepID=A0A6B0GSA6_9EURY|nr:hypothetical protein [Halomarina oriensis]MWG34975.1 hypothetical protein [Halomarina oriensis]
MSPPSDGSSDRSGSSDIPRHPSGPVDPAPVEWRYDPTTVRWLRGVAAVRTALVSTATALVVAVLAALVGLASLFVDGVPDTDGVAVVLVSLAFGLVRVALSPMGVLLISRTERERIASTGVLAVSDGVGPRPFSRRRLAVAVLGALVVVTAAWLWLPAVLALVAVGVVAALVVGVVSTAGRLDPERRTYTLHAGGERSFAGLSGHARHRLGPLVLFRLHYPRRPGRLTKLQRVLVPATDAPAVTAVLEHAATTGRSRTTDDASRSSNRTVTLVAGAMGLAHVVGAALAVGLLGGVLGWYLAAIGVTVGLLLLSVAVFEG